MFAETQQPIRLSDTHVYPKKKRPNLMKCLSLLSKIILACITPKLAILKLPGERKMSGQDLKAPKH